MADIQNVQRIPETMRPRTALGTAGIISMVELCVAMFWATGRSLSVIAEVPTQEEILIDRLVILNGGNSRVFPDQAIHAVLFSQK